MGKMRAAQFYGKEDLRIEQIEEKQCGPGQVKVRTHISEGYMVYSGDEDRTWFCWVCYPLTHNHPFGPNIDEASAAQISMSGQVRSDRVPSLRALC